jgi:hypothetical protein
MINKHMLADADEAPEIGVKRRKYGGAFIYWGTNNFA